MSYVRKFGLDPTTNYLHIKDNGELEFRINTYNVARIEAIETEGGPSYSGKLDFYLMSSDIIRRKATLDKDGNFLLAGDIVMSGTNITTLQDGTTNEDRTLTIPSYQLSAGTEYDGYFVIGENTTTHNNVTYYDVIRHQRWKSNLGDQNIDIATFESYGIAHDYSYTIRFDDRDLYFYNGGSYNGASGAAAAGAGGCMTIHKHTGIVDITNGTRIGDYSGGDYTYVSGTGQVTLHGDARVKKVILLPLDKFDKSATNPPGESHEQGFATLDFDDNKTEEVFSTFYGPLDWDPTSGAVFKLGFFVDTAPASAANVVWRLEYKSIACDGIFDFSTGTSTVSDTVAITTGTPTNDKKVHCAELTVPYTGLIAGGILMVRIYRDGTDPSDTVSGDARIFEMRIEYTSNRLGQEL